MKLNINKIKKPLIFAGSLIIVLLIGLVINKSLANPNVGYLKNQVIDGLSIENAEINYANGITTFTAEVHNENESGYQLAYISINLKDDDNNKTELVGYIGEGLQPGEYRKITASIDKDLTNSTSINYTIEKEFLNPNVFYAFGIYETKSDFPRTVTNYKYLDSNILTKLENDQLSICIIDNNKLKCFEYEYIYAYNGLGATFDSAINYMKQVLETDNCFTDDDGDGMFHCVNDNFNCYMSSASEFGCRDKKPTRVCETGYSGVYCHTYDFLD